MNGYTIPIILSTIILVAGIFVFLPIEQATSVHTTIQANTDAKFRDSGNVAHEGDAVAAITSTIETVLTAAANRVLFVPADGIQVEVTTALEANEVIDIIVTRPDGSGTNTVSSGAGLAAGAVAEFGGFAGNIVQIQLRNTTGAGTISDTDVVTVRIFAFQSG